MVYLSAHTKQDPKGIFCTIGMKIIRNIRPIFVNAGGDDRFELYSAIPKAPTVKNQLLLLAATYLYLPIFQQLIVSFFKFHFSRTTPHPIPGHQYSQSQFDHKASNSGYVFRQEHLDLTALLPHYCTNSEYHSDIVQKRIGKLETRKQ